MNLMMMMLNNLILMMMMIIMMMMTMSATCPINSVPGQADDPKKHWLLQTEPRHMSNKTVELVDEVFRNRWRTLLSVDDLVLKVSWWRTEDSGRHPLGAPRPGDLLNAEGHLYSLYFGSRLPPRPGGVVYTILAK